jgi:integrase
MCSRCGTKRIDQLERVDFARMLETITSDVGHNQTVKALSSMFTWARNTGRYKGENHAKGLLRSETPRDRELSVTELRTVWWAAKHIGGDFGKIVRLLILLPLRSREVGNLRADQVQLDHELGPMLVLGAATTKARREHWVPLPQAAVEILRPLLARAEQEQRTYLFGAGGENGYTIWPKAAALGRKVAKLPSWELRDLRRSVATHMADEDKLNVSDDLIERLLDHAPQGVTRKHYNKSKKLTKQRAALEAWAAYLLDGVPTAAAA